MYFHIQQSSYSVYCFYSLQVKLFQQFCPSMQEQLSICFCCKHCSVLFSCIYPTLHVRINPFSRIIFPWASLVAHWEKNLPSNAGGMGSIPKSGRSLGEGNGKPFQYSCLENPVDRGAWQATVHGVAELDTTERKFIYLILQICITGGWGRLKEDLGVGTQEFVTSASDQLTSLTPIFCPKMITSLIFQNILSFLTYFILYCLFNTSQ